MVKKETFDGGSEMEQQLENEPGQSDDVAFVRRNRPGTSCKNWCKWANEDLDEMDSTLAVQQFIQQLIRDDPSNVELILKSPDQQDEGVWKYEHVRQFCMDLNLITVRLQEECSPSTCSQMTATEQWIFLCAAHKNPKECSAIDYTRHTLDGAACLLNSNRYFPSRVNIKDSSIQKLGSVCRRVYRIFSHAYFHHRHIFDEFERETSLCKRFTKFVIKYDLMTSDTLIVPIDGGDNNTAGSMSSPSTSPSQSQSQSSPTSSSSTTSTTSSSEPVAQAAVDPSIQAGGGAGGDGQAVTGEGDGEEVAGGGDASSSATAATPVSSSSSSPPPPPPPPSSTQPASNHSPVSSSSSSQHSPPLPPLKTSPTSSSTSSTSSSSTTSNTTTTENTENESDA